MKNLIKINVVALIMLISFNSFAQKVSGGLFIGPNVSWYTLDTKVAQNKGVKLGYMFGATMDFNLVENFAISTGINFNSMGGSQWYEHGVHNLTRQDLGDISLGPSSTIKFKMDYIELPVGLKGKTNEIGYMTYFLKAGVTPGVNIKARADVTVDSNDIITAERKLFNLGWHIGGGFEWSLSGSTRLLTEVVYTGGILDTDKIEVLREDNTSTNVNSKLNNIALKVGVIF
ncbi:MAG: PorT family protein [Bacteroidales bacterium]|nr:PorT family protein [Bacteroidales bacterium]